jgi:plastocyanin
MRRTIGIACLTLATLGLVACSGGSAGGGDAGAVIRTFRFRPGTVAVAAGTTVTWKNRDDIEHTVTSDTKGAFAGTLNGAGTTFAHRFATPGTYAYHCSIHTSMRGRVVVSK